MYAGIIYKFDWKVKILFDGSEKHRWLRSILRKMKYKYLAVDLDGTLTLPDKSVSEKNIEYIMRAQNAGVSVILASGRPLIGIEHVAETLNLYGTNSYILAYNGGQIVDLASGEDIIKKLIPMRCVHQICDLINRFDVVPLTYNDIGVIAERDDTEYVKKESYNNSVPIIKVKSLEKEITNPVVKFMTVGDPEQVRKAMEYLKKEVDGQLNIFCSEPYFMEITPLGIEKATSLEFLLSRLGSSREELIAIGDGFNDIPMLKYAGLGIAMGNAYDEVKKISDAVTLTNEEDGVAASIEEYILN